MTPSDAVERAGRTERAAIVATLARRLGDLDRAEDAVQDAFAAAATRWPRDGVPDRPGAWLTTTAWRRALDVRRRERRRPVADLPMGLDALPHAEVEPSPLELDGEPVDRLLGLLLACCHPALAPEARVALTLRHVGGLTAGEIAAAFLVAEATMAKRLVRARAKLRDAGVAFEVPDARALPGRLADARAVIYLIFTEGHLASGDGPPVRAELCDEALWLAQQLAALARDAETDGLLALLLFLQARRPARLHHGRLVPPQAQDRTQWDADLMREARRTLAAARGPLGPYQVEAAIAALHAAAASVEATDWPQVAALYEVLDRLAPSPVVTVNRAVAVGHAEGPQAGLDVLSPVVEAGRLDGYAPLHAARAALLARAGRRREAAQAWQRAATVASHEAGRTYALEQSAVLSPATGTSEE